MRKRTLLLAFLLAVGCFEEGLPGERLADSERPCPDCTPEPSCPSGERCADDTRGLRFRPPSVRVCGDVTETVAVVRGTGPMPILARGGTMTLEVSELTWADREPGAIVAVVDDAVLAVRELSIEETGGRATVVLEGVGAGTSNVSIRRVDGDLLIDRTRVSVGEVSSVRLVPPGIVGCVRDPQVLLRSMEVAPVPQLFARNGALLVDERAHVLTADGEALGPVPAEVDRVSLLVVGGGARTPVELDVVDRADAIERASAARDLLLDQRGGPTEVMHCYRAVHGGREVVGAAFEMESVEDERRRPVDADESSPQCVRAGEVSSRATFHVRAAGAERVEEAL